MIENHLEHTIIDKHNLINLLYKTPRLALIEANQSTNLSTLQIKKYLEELSDLFQEEVSIVIDKGIILCHFNKPCKDFYSFEVYRQSNVLQLLKFLIKNDTSSKSLSSFAKKHFLSSSGTYRLRTALTPLLKEFGLKLSKNTIVGEEYRLRYFIALLQSKFGIDIYHLSSKDKMVIREFLFLGSTNLQLSNTLSKSFLFYNVLLALSWKRHDKHVIIPPSDILDSLKALFIYDDIDNCARHVITSRFQILLNDHDLAYLFLIHLTATHSFATQKWSEEHTEQLLLIFQSHAAFQSLFQPISELIPLSLENRELLLKIVVYFARYFILDLQQFIPEKSYFPLDYYPGHPVIAKTLKPIVTTWLQQIKGSSLNQQYFFLLCSHIEQLIKNSLSAITVVLITTDFINEQLLTDYISKHLSTKNIIFYSYYLLTDDIYAIKDLNPNLIITHQKLIPFVKKKLSPEAIVVDFDNVNTHVYIRRIHDIVLSIEENHYQQYIQEYFNQ
ncbi:TPA: helix-turn-helix domain-containing protein [Streptococcus equi subsp. zooepidemicus]|nr:helix-turn-helix domain-containing protein [Streptococcus equi subsp. zooepidemicus]HEL1344452.1 helix-turn-helix domain-containing protein [Streptococcus equi subsp. zooepidemicus]